MTKPTVASTKKAAKSVALPTSVVDKDKEIELLTARLSNMETMLNKVLFQLGMNEPMVQKTNKKKLISFIGLMNLDNPDLSEPHLVCDEEELVCKVISMKKDKLAELCQCVLEAEDGEEIELEQDEFTITDRLCSKIDDGKYGFIQ
jgi:hypothetical protein